MSKSIQLIDLSLSFPHKICFEGFNTQILPGSRVGIIGRNGSGKSSLLKMIQGSVLPSEGEVRLSDNCKIGYVPQLIENEQTSSGGERFNQALTQALSEYPDVLLLDEPTNHLDQKNRKSLMRLLQAYEGILIVVTHDPELLRHVTHTLWHLDREKVQIFSGNYNDYQQQLLHTRLFIEAQLMAIKKQQKAAHESLMREQIRSSKSRAKGEKSIEQRKWPTVVSSAKAGRGEETSGMKQKAISERRDSLREQLQDLPTHEIIVPKFSIPAHQISSQVLVTVNDGSVSYGNFLVLKDLHFSLMADEKVALVGDNGSGKSTFIKALLNYPSVARKGTWLTPKIEEVGYLDQHYEVLDPEKTVIHTIERLRPSWTYTEIRKHLNDFLFRKNEEVEMKVANLSGGEKARLSLAQIAAKTPQLLILDEITNNLDLETRAHVIQVLKEYPSALLIISHDEDFLEEVGITRNVILNKTISS